MSEELFKAIEESSIDGTEMSIDEKIDLYIHNLGYGRLCVSDIPTSSIKRCCQAVIMYWEGETTLCSMAGLIQSDLDALSDMVHRIEAKLESEKYSPPSAMQSLGKAFLNPSANTIHDSPF